MEQSKGSSLGYTIMPYDPAGAHKGKEPNLLAFRVPLDGSARSMRFRALDAKGEVLAGSEREIRVVGRIPASWLLLVLALVPLLAMVVVLVVRSRAYAAGSIDES